MKVFHSIGWAEVLIPALFACDNYEMPPFIPQTGSSITTLAAGSAVVLKKNGADITNLEFTVTPADFGPSGVVKYELQMDLPGANFTAPVSLGTSESNIIAVNVAELNKALLCKKLPFGVAADVEFRMKSTIDLALSPITGVK